MRGQPRCQEAGSGMQGRGGLTAAASAAILGPSSGSETITEEKNMAGNRCRHGGAGHGMAARLLHRIATLALLAGGVVAALTALGGQSAAAQVAKRPNILVIVADDMGYADCGVQGCKDIPTPHIDSLAKNGVRCTS